MKNIKHYIGPALMLMGFCVLIITVFTFTKAVLASHSRSLSIPNLWVYILMLIIGLVLIFISYYLEQKNRRID